MKEIVLNIIVIFAILGFVYAAHWRWKTNDERIFKRRTEFTFDCECGHGKADPKFNEPEYEGVVRFGKMYFTCNSCTKLHEWEKLPNDVKERIWNPTPPVYHKFNVLRKRYGLRSCFNW